MERRFVSILLASAAFMPLLLFLDRDGFGNQVALGLTTALFLSLVVRRTAVRPIEVLCCILVATTGEIVLSLGWGLYSYGHAVIPFYVPPGHGLFYTLAAATAGQDVFRRRAAAITRVVVTVGTLIALANLVVRNDAWGFLWWAGAVALIRFSRNQLMLTSCFVYTIILEWGGTAIGNWQWAADVPFVGLHCANPPSGVGILYILLDLIVVAITGKLAREPIPGEAAGAPRYADGDVGAPPYASAISAFFAFFDATSRAE